MIEQQGMSLYSFFLKKELLYGDYSHSPPI